MKRILQVIICITLTVVLLQACSTNEKSEPIQWSVLELGSMLPEPQGMNGEVGVDLAHALSVTLHNITKEQYKGYKNNCIEAGYTVESDDTGTSYIAFNSDGYQLRLVYSFEELYIHLDAPEKMDKFEWPVNGLGSMLPATKSTLGDISWNNSETFIVHVGNTTIDEYNDYVKACEEKGFTVDFSKDDKYYSADNAEGYKLTLRYLGFNRIEVSLEAPEDETSSDETETSPSTEESKGNDVTSSTISKEFKEAMDSYEQFMDEYVAFMKKFKANPTDMDLLADYATYMSKYAEFVEDFDKWENEEMNAAETAYYIDVQARVSKKLLEVAQ